VVEVEDAVEWLRSVDAALEFDLFVVVGSWKIAGESPVNRSEPILGSELTLEEGAGDGVQRGCDTVVSICTSRTRRYSGNKCLLILI